MSWKEPRSYASLRTGWAWTHRGEGRVRLLAGAALLAGAGYLAWRLLSTVAGAPLWLAVPLLLAEALGWLQLAHLAFEAWRVPPAGAPGAPAPGRRAVLVAAAGASATELERTLLGCRALDGGPRVLVAGADEACSALSARLGAPAGAQDVPGALGTLDADLVLLLRAGDVPARDAIERAARHLAGPRTVAVQCRAEAADPGSVAVAVAGTGGGELLQQVVNPSLGARGLVVASSSGLLVRRDAAVAAAAGRGGLRAAAALLGGGGRVAFAPDAVVRTVPPATLEGFLDASGRGARAGLALLGAPGGPVRGRALGPGRRAALAGPAVRALAGPRMLVLLAVLVGTLIAGRSPIDARPAVLAVMWAPWAVLSVLGWLALARGTRALGDRSRSGMRLMGEQCTALARIVLGRGDRVRRGSAQQGVAAVSRMGLLVAALLAVDVALVARGISQHVDTGLIPMSGNLMWVVAAFGVVAAVLMLDVLQLVAVRRQDRRTHRLVVDLAARVDGAPARVVDLTPDGLRVTGVGLTRGARVALAVELPAADGAPAWVDLQGVVRNATPAAAGLELVDVGAREHQALATYYWVTRPARLREGLDEAGDAVVLPAGPSAPLIGGRLGRLSRVATGAGVAGLAVALVPSTLMAADDLRVTPAQGSATVDGVVEDAWDGPDVDLWGAAGSRRREARVLARARLRYDCATRTLFVLVRAEPGHVVDEGAGNGLRAGAPAAAVAASAGPVYLGAGRGGRTGWEAAFPLEPDASGRTGAEVRATIGGGRAASTSAGPKGAVGLALDCAARGPGGGREADGEGGERGRRERGDGDRGERGDRDRGERGERARGARGVRGRRRSGAGREDVPEAGTVTETAPAEEARTETAPAEEARTETAPAEEARTETAPAEEARTETAPAEEARTETAPAEEARTETAPAEEATGTDTSPRQETPARTPPPEETTGTVPAGTTTSPAADGPQARTGTGPGAAAPQVTTPGAPVAPPALRDAAPGGRPAAAPDEVPAAEQQQPSGPSTAVTARTRLGIDVRGPGRAQAGGVAVYALTVRNAGRAAAEGVTVTGRVPRGLAPVGARPAAWRMGRIPAGGSRTVTLRLRVAGAAGPACTLAVAMAHNSRTVRDAACTRVAARPGGGTP